MDSEYGDVLSRTEFHLLHYGRTLKRICHVKSEPELCLEMKEMFSSTVRLEMDVQLCVLH